MGRVPKPTELKRLQGTLRKHRTNRREPKPPATRPKIPRELSREAKRFWRHLVAELESMRVLTHPDGAMLGLIAEAWAEWRQADALVRRDGMVYEATTKSGRLLQAHPAVRQRADAWRRVHKGLVEFGLTPAARTRIALEASGPEHSEDEDFLFGPRDFGLVKPCGGKRTA